MKMEKYLSKLEKHLAATSVEKRIDYLRTRGPKPSDSDFQCEYEKISADVDAAMRAGIKEAQWKNVGYARSPTLTKTASYVRFWRTQLRAKRNKTPLSAATLDFASSHNLPQQVLPLSQIFIHLQQAWAALRTAQRQANELRLAWLEKMVEAAAEANDTSKAVALQQMLQENRIRKLFRKLKPLSSVVQSGAVSRFKIPRFQWFYHEGMDLLFYYNKGAFYSHARLPSIDEGDAPFSLQHTRRPLPSRDVKVASVAVMDSHIILQQTQSVGNLWNEVTDSDELEALLLERNAEHLRQCTVNAKADTILSSKLDIDSLLLTDEAKVWLCKMRFDTAPPADIDLSFTPTQFKHMTRACNTRTSASPSGFGYIVWRANGQSEVGCKVFSVMLSLSFQRVFAPQRWKKFLEIMLEKDQGNPLIHRLRLIVLLESDFNLALRAIWMKRLLSSS